MNREERRRLARAKPSRLTTPKAKPVISDVDDRGIRTITYADDSVAWDPESPLFAESPLMV